MYKQYTTLDKMIKQIKIMLEKEVLKANLQVAGGASSSGDSAAENVEFENCGIKVDDTEVINCLRGNLAKYDPFVTKGNIRNDVRKSMKKDADVIKSWRTKIISECTENMNNKVMTECYSGIAKEINAWNKEIKDEDRDKKLIEAIYKRGL
jgi:hypothetical protein